MSLSFAMLGLERLSAEGLQLLASGELFPSLLILPPLFGGFGFPRPLPKPKGADDWVIVVLFSAEGKPY